MSLLFDLEALTEESGVDAIQIMQRDFNQHLIHFTNSKAMKPVIDCMIALSSGKESNSNFLDLLSKADAKSKCTMEKIFHSEHVTKSIRGDGYNDFVSLTECTLPGVLGHSARYGRYGLVFEKASIHELGGRPLAYVSREVRQAYIEQNDRDTIIKENLANVAILKLSDDSAEKPQDFSHEREWRCPEEVPVDKAVAVIVAKAKDCKDFADLAHGRPILPLGLLYRMGL